MLRCLVKLVIFDVLFDYRKENGSGQMGTPLVLISGRIVMTLRIRMKTVPTSCYQVSGFTRFFHMLSAHTTAPRKNLKFGSAHFYL